ncbi:hypothetical protein OsI_22213 [Oryza sativa Indica Group]|uniref:Uncharacterized protein n=2 Tax=Oryza sativa TaxID=4530 RepID=Q67UI3_ORYSJ|nr:hypothetical protein OsI_22213 [Oryza sativa Indica Group]EAZ36324.1 hypothetical protein OsJ_20647 [Oryza sativa Japonica Group]BAD38186.1 hypothetical protein [Oryza sativa Japonica Group]
MAMSRSTGAVRCSSCPTVATAPKTTLSCPAPVVHVQRYALVKQGSEGHEYAAEQLVRKMN